MAVLFLGGTGTEVKKGGGKSANGYLANLEAYLRGNGLEEVLQQQGKDPDIKKSIGLYSVIYDFGVDMNGDDICKKDVSREKLYADYGQITSSNKEQIKKDLANLNKETVNPHYIDELFKMAFLSRICDENGKKLPVKEACQRVRNLNICAHCHGAYTFLKIEEKMQQKMKEIGYLDEECAKIQSQLLCVTLAPDAPLGVSKSKMISFASASDTTIRMNGCSYNNFKKAIHDMLRRKNNGDVNAGEIKPSYLPGKQGEVFLVEKIYEDSEYNEVGGVEHNFFLDPDHSLTNAGKMLFFIAITAVVNGLESSLKKTSLPSTEDLICGKSEANKAAFQKLKKNGEDLWNTIRRNLKETLLYKRGQNKR